MSYYDYENFSEGDWDDRSDLAWSEFDWERYLCEQEDIFHRYLSLYAKFRNRSDRLDRVAYQMGWDSGEWTSARPLGEDEDCLDEDFFQGISGERGEEDDAEDPLDPYTLYRHPIFVATRSLYISLNEAWERLIANPTNRLHPTLAHSFQKSLQRGETHAIFAIHALDMGDYSLCVAQLKRALSDLNQSIHFLEEIARLRTYSTSIYQREALAQLFDLREIWLRVTHYCREEVNRRYNDED